MESNSARGSVIRIVDDDPTVRRALIRLIESMQLEAQAYASPEELLDATPGEDTGCLLLDVQLPGMTGFELYRRLSAADREIPVVFITGVPSEQSRQAAAAARAVAFLEKPFDEEALFAAIRQALGPRQR